MIAIWSHQPGSADRVVVEFSRLRGRIPALDDAVLRRRLGGLEVAAEPVPADHVAAGWHRRLLVLRREVHAAEGLLDAGQCLAVLTLGVKEFTGLAQFHAVPADRYSLFGLGDRREIEMDPGFLLQHVSDKVVDVKALHDEDDHVLVLAVEPGVKGIVEPLLHRLALHG